MVHGSRGDDSIHKSCALGGERTGAGTPSSKSGGPVEQRASFRLEDGYEVTGPDAGFILRAFFRRELAIIALPGQFLHASLCSGIGAELDQGLGRFTGEAPADWIEQTIEDWYSRLAHIN